jgi:hypothetical protein
MGWFFSLGFSKKLTPQCKKSAYYETPRASDMDGIFFFLNSYHLNVTFFWDIVQNSP